MMVNFKAGDLISPKNRECIKEFPNWENLEIVSFCSDLCEAVVRQKDGWMCNHFNLDPEFGEEFEVVGSV